MVSVFTNVPEGKISQRKPRLKLGYMWSEKRKSKMSEYFRCRIKENDRYAMIISNGC